MEPGYIDYEDLMARFEKAGILPAMNSTDPDGNTCAAIFGDSLVEALAEAVAVCTSLEETQFLIRNAHWDDDPLVLYWPMIVMRF